MPVFPPGVPVTVRLDGRPLPAYVSAYDAGGRVYAPVRPAIALLADRLWFDGNVLVIVRDGRIVTIRLAGRSPDALDAAYVPVAKLLRALGERVSYSPRERSLDVTSRDRTAVAPPTPFDGSAPSAAPHVVFTPQPVPTPRPVWSGSPLPRRTPLPASAIPPRS